MSGKPRVSQALETAGLPKEMLLGCPVFYLRREPQADAFRIATSGRKAMRRANALTLTIAIPLVLNAGLTAGPSAHAGSAATLLSAINLPDGLQRGDQFGYSIAISKDPRFGVIGAPGRSVAYLFVQSETAMTDWITRRWPGLVGLAISWRSPRTATLQSSVPPDQQNLYLHAGPDGHRRGGDS